MASDDNEDDPANGSQQAGPSWKEAADSFHNHIFSCDLCYAPANLLCEEGRRLKTIYEHAVKRRDASASPQATRHSSTPADISGEHGTPIVRTESVPPGEAAFWRR